MSEFVCAEGPCLHKPFTTNDQTEVDGHIASKHLNYLPSVYGICHDQGTKKYHQAQKPENDQHMDNPAPPIKFEEKFLDDGVFGRFFKQEQTTNPEPFEIISDSLGFVITDADTDTGRTPCKKDMDSQIAQFMSPCFDDVDPDDTKVKQEEEEGQGSALEPEARTAESAEHVSEPIRKPVSMISETSGQSTTISESAKNLGMSIKPEKHLIWSRISDQQSNNLPVTESTRNSATPIQSSTLSSRKRVLIEFSEQPMIIGKSPKRVSDVYVLQRNGSGTSRNCVDDKSSDKQSVNQSIKNSCDTPFLLTTTGQESDTNQELTVSESSEQANDAFESSRDHGNIYQPKWETVAIPIYDVMECRICKKHVRKNLLKSHVIAHHLTGHFFHCGYCNFSARDASNVAYHQKKMHFKTPKVQRNQEFEDAIAKQMTVCFDDQPLIKREVTKFVPASNPSLQSHQVTVESVVPTIKTKIMNDSKECYECKKIVRVCSLKDHVMTHHLSKPYFNCDICSFTTKWQNSMVYHCKNKHHSWVVNSNMEEQLTEMMAQCFDGQPMVVREVITFVVPSSLKSLVPSQWSYSKKKQTHDQIECLQCGQKVKDVSQNLKEHIMTFHVDADCFMCSHCSFTAHSSNAVHRHCLVEHPSLKSTTKSREKSLSSTIEEMLQKCFNKISKCDKCGFVAKSGRLLKVHRLNHKRSQRFSSFGQSTSSSTQNSIESQLASVTGSSLHVVSHGTPNTDMIKKSSSPIIPESSSMNIVCPKIESIIDTSKYILCQICDKFVLISHKQAHIRSDHLEEESFACPYCDYSSAYDLTCVSHIINDHNRFNKPTNLIKTDPQLALKVQQLNLECFGETIKIKVARNGAEKNSNNDNNHSANTLVYKCQQCDFTAESSRLLKVHKFNHRRNQSQRLSSFDQTMSPSTQSIELHCIAIENQLASVSVVSSSGTLHTDRIKNSSSPIIPESSPQKIVCPKPDSLDTSKFILCQICNSRVCYGKKQPHIASHHLEENSYACPYCDYSSAYYNCCLHHFKKHHNGIKFKPPKNLMKTDPELALKVQQLQLECFGGKTKSVSISKPKTPRKIKALLSQLGKLPLPIPLETPAVFFCNKCNQSTSECEEHAWGHLEPTPDHLPCRCTFPECPYEAFSPTAVAQHAAIQHHVDKQEIQYFLIHTDNKMLDTVKEMVSECFG